MVAAAGDGEGHATGQWNDGGAEATASVDIRSRRVAMLAPTASMAPGVQPAPDEPRDAAERVSHPMPRRIEYQFGNERHEHESEEQDPVNPMRVDS